MNKGPAQGFSLLELLVALVIVALLTSAVSLSLALGEGDEANLLQGQADSLLRQFEAAQQEAILGNTHIGLRLEPRDAPAGLRLQWLRYGNELWSVADDLLPPVDLPPALQVQLALDGELVAIGNSETTGLPQLLLEPDGWLPAFELRLSNTNSIIRVGTDERGRLQAWPEAAR